MLKVAKFGGTSMADSTQLKKVRDIIKGDDERRLVVVSAPGKRFKDDNKITDLLYLTHAHTKFSVPHAPILKIIEDRYNLIKEELHLNIDLEKEFNVIRDNLDNKCDEDYIVSRGEYLRRFCKQRKNQGKIMRSRTKFKESRHTGILWSIS